MSYSIKFLLLVMLIIFFNNLIIINNGKANINISACGSIFPRFENLSQNNLLYSQSFLSLSLKSNAPSKKSDKKGLEKSFKSKNNGERENEPKKSFEETMDEFSAKLEKFSVSGPGVKTVEVPCADLMALANVVSQAIQLLQALISSINNFSPFEFCLQVLLSRYTGKGTNLVKLTLAIRKISSALESQKSLNLSLEKMLAESESVLSLILALISQCTMNASQTLLVGTPRHKRLFGLNGKVQVSKKNVASFSSHAEKVYSEICNDVFISEVDKAILSLQASDATESMEVD
ncbi:putative low complexity [Cryptosporidium sp. chipmunk genotype I]|uniref:putative low complexity n=1 Tax=Cryptosporidium sp. chipmunk genotype I TaxID=1280935 RepID=UPI00351A32E3|nr:putative low complexity [Cryptosporidium sp. chipmunk genotype I]